MAETYSVGVTGCLAENPNASRSATAGLIDVGDSVGASPGIQQNAMMLGTPFLARGLDGGQFWAVYDAERSIPGTGPLVLKRV